jgi:hypothetical protein
MDERACLSVGALLGEPEGGISVTGDPGGCLTL